MGNSDPVALGGAPLLPDVADYWPPRSPVIEAALLDAYLATGWWRYDGRWNDRLEAALSCLSGGRPALAVASGTLALEVALRCAGVGASDEVIVPALTFVAPSMAASLCGATVVPVDVDPRSWCLDPDAVLRAMSPRTRAIIAVHLSGQVADLDAISAIARRPGGPVLIEDCAQAIGSRWRGGPVGLQGRFATFSFQSSKTLPAGEGGAIVFAAADDHRTASALINNGNDVGTLFTHRLRGTNARLGEFAAAVACSQAEGLEEIADRRHANRAAVAEILDGLPGVALQGAYPANDRIAAWSVAFTVEDAALGGLDRKGLLTALRSEGLVALPMYPLPCELPSLRIPSRRLPPVPVSANLRARGVCILGLFLAGASDLAGRAALAIARVIAAAPALATVQNRASTSGNDAKG